MARPIPPVRGEAIIGIDHRRVLDAERLEFLDVLLGDRPALSAPEIFYQRILAGDPAEAADKAEVMAQLIGTGFDGFLLDDHVPHMDGDSDWNHRGRAHAIGYMQGLIRMADFLKA